MSSRLDVLVEGNHNIPFALVPLEKETAQLPLGTYKDENGVVHYDSNKVNFFVESSNSEDFEGGYKKVHKVDSDEEFADIKERMLSLPTVFGVYITEFTPQVETLMPFMVYINPCHPDIKQQLEDKFAECEKVLADQGGFSLEIKVGEDLAQWFTRRRNTPVYPHYSSHGSTICVTNLSRRCGMLYRPWIWLCPSTWIFGPCYLCARALTCKDIRLKLSGVAVLK